MKTLRKGTPRGKAGDLAVFEEVEEIVHSFTIVELDRRLVQIKKDLAEVEDMKKQALALG